MKTYFQPMSATRLADRDRCANCHLPQMDHYSGVCPEECDECGMVASGQFLTAEGHADDCSQRTRCMCCSESMPHVHPYCNVCGWRKGGADSWDGARCKCRLSEPALPRIASALLLVLVFTLSGVHARAVDLNQIVLGSQATPETLKAQLGVEVPPAAQGAHIASGTYSGFGTLASAGTQAFVHIDESGAIDEIRIEFTSGIGWSRIRPAAIAKWGQPARSSTVDVSNAFGLALKDELLTWTFPDRSQAVLTHYIDLDTGELDITTEARTPKQAKGGAL